MTMPTKKPTQGTPREPYAPTDPLPGPGVDGIRACPAKAIPVLIEAMHTAIAAITARVIDYANTPGVTYADASEMGVRAGVKLTGYSQTMFDYAAIAKVIGDAATEAAAKRAGEMKDRALAAVRKICDAVFLYDRSAMGLPPTRMVGNVVVFRVAVAVASVLPPGVREKPRGVADLPSVRESPPIRICCAATKGFYSPDIFPEGAPKGWIAEKWMPSDIEYFDWMQRRTPDRFGPAESRHGPGHICYIGAVPRPFLECTLAEIHAAHPEGGPPPFGDPLSVSVLAPDLASDSARAPPPAPPSKGKGKRKGKKTRAEECAEGGAPVAAAS